MIYARVHAKVTRAPAEQARRAGQKIVTAGLTANVSGEFVQVNAIAVGESAQALLAFRLGENLEVAGPIQPRTFVDEDGRASATFDVRVREVSRPTANWGNQA